VLRKKYRLFWTGGFDSTFRLAELSRRNVKIQPVYLVFNDRRDVTPLELAAHGKILQWLKKRPETQAMIQPVRYVTENQIIVSNEVEHALAWIRQRYAVPQCDRLLAAYAEKSKGIEVGLEKPYDKPGRTFIVLNAAGGLHFDEEGIGRLEDPNHEHPQIMKIHGNYGYSIANRTEVEMWEQLQEWGYQDLVKLTQTCEHPYHGTPCGCCTNCFVKIHSAMGWYLGDKAQRRHAILLELREKDPELASVYRAYMTGRFAPLKGTGAIPIQLSEKIAQCNRFLAARNAL